MTLMHIPYTSMIFAYITIGTMLAPPPVNLELLGLALLAYFLGLGLAAHALDQTSPTGSRYIKLISQRELKLIALLSLAGAVGVGVFSLSRFHLTPWVVPLILVNVFFVFAYPRGDWFRGFFHNDGWFAFSWGFIPFLTAYTANLPPDSRGLAPLPIYLIGAILAITALMEITLSRWARNARKFMKVELVRVEPNPRGFLSMTSFSFSSERRETVTVEDHVRKPELALKLLVLVVDLSAVAVALMRLS